MRVPSFVLIGLMALFASQGAAQSPRNSGAPEMFSANAQAKGGAGYADEPIKLVTVSRKNL